MRVSAIRPLKSRHRTRFAGSPLAVSEHMAVADGGDGPPALRELAELRPMPPRPRRVAPSVLRVRPCKGPAILYCRPHRELFDAWIFWDPAAYGDVHEDAVRGLEAYLSWLEPERGPSGKARDARLVELVTTFLKRHPSCAVRVCRDGSSEYAEVIGQGEEAWTVFCLSEDDPFWEQACLAQVERCRREIHRLRHGRPNRLLSYDERVQRMKDREAWTRHLRLLEKDLRKTGRLWPDHVPFGDVLELLRSAPWQEPLAYA